MVKNEPYGLRNVRIISARSGLKTIHAPVEIGLDRFDLCDAEQERVDQTEDVGGHLLCGPDTVRLGLLGNQAGRTHQTSATGLSGKWVGRAVGFVAGELILHAPKFEDFLAVHHGPFSTSPAALNRRMGEKTARHLNDGQRERQLHQ